MPIDPYAALNAMLRAEAARFSPPVRPAAERSAPQPAAATATATAATATATAERETGPKPAPAPQQRPADPAA
ncbi:hypothetical protein ACGFXC_14645 [Streptomyces sp. NPDC048507]|uniref:hypothetical protein n=1 Tax=Streptomyces sp. NPDC048507 TaxID=3365560 RepID=UPI003718243E